jgi:hypothetical protein
MSHVDPTMEPHPLKDSSGWYVLIVWPTGPEQHVTGFATEAQARAWINDDSEAWTAKVTRPRPTRPPGTPETGRQ